jgi:hypothetical protein
MHNRYGPGAWVALCAHSTHNDADTLRFIQNLSIQNTELLIEAGGTYNSHWALKA